MLILILGDTPALEACPHEEYDIWGIENLFKSYTKFVIISFVIQIFIVCKVLKIIKSRIVINL